MTAPELQAQLNSAHPPFLLHVLPEEIFAARRIPGSRNACAYEVAFLKTVAALVPDQSTVIVVYGAGDGSLDSQVASEKLRGAGYRAVEDFRGGLAEWERNAGSVEGSGAPTEDLILSPGRYEVTTEQSVIRWTGRNLFNHHSGTVRFAAGSLIIEGNALKNASFTIAMNSIDCEDIADESVKAVLIEHLENADFFDVGIHPEAAFEAGSAEVIPNSTPGSPNFRIRGTFTLRGITKPLEFDTVIAAASETELVAQAWIDFDRTQFGSNYGSGRFFRFLGKHIVNDMVHLHLRIHALRSEA